MFHQRKWIALFGCAALLAATPMLASAHTHVFLGINLGGLFAPPPVVYAPRVVYPAPPPVVYAPPVRYGYYAPRAYYAPAYYGGTVYIDHGGWYHRHWDHDHWHRGDWDHHHWDHDRGDHWHHHDDD